MSITTSSYTLYDNLDNIDTGLDVLDDIVPIYPCYPIYNQYRPIDTYIELYGVLLDDTDILKHENTDGTIGYSTRYLTLSSIGGNTSFVNAHFNGVTIPLSSKLYQCTCVLGDTEAGTNSSGSVRAFGFSPDLTTWQGANRLFFYFVSDTSYIGIYNSYITMDSCPLGRDITEGDALTIRVKDDIAKFYVNGELQYTTDKLPSSDLECGIGVYANSTTPTYISTNYMSLQVIP